MPASSDQQRIPLGGDPLESLKERHAPRQRVFFLCPSFWLGTVVGSMAHFGALINAREPLHKAPFIGAFTVLGFGWVSMRIVRTLRKNDMDIKVELTAMEAELPQLKQHGHVISKLDPISQYQRDIIEFIALQERRKEQVAEQ
eukprot:TRINITY_DN2637_c0_g1_i2.p1 TRINITY_DN2637_c0_g1~~TRINITY_DN2637_c0_g1_i2.p1  ORF type:complete len:143 (-),score=36.22 TRINITY_DN2637_c0_g1_i2:36-464(-)